MDKFDWSEISVSDVDQRIAIVVTLPFGFPRTEPARFANTVEQIAKDALPRALSADLRVMPYQVGPAAEWFPVFLLTIQQVGPQLLELAANLVEVASGAFLAVKQIRRWTEEQERDTNVPKRSRAPFPVVSAPIIVGMCLSHYRDSYDELRHITIDWHARTTNDFGDVGHPVGYETYTISVRAKDRTVIYVVNGYCEVTEHFSVADKEVHALPLPNWFALPYFPQERSLGGQSICLE